MGIEDVKLLEECFREALITGELSESSVAKYRDSFKKFFLVIGDKPLKELTCEDFGDFILNARAGGAGNSRIANVISSIKWVLKRLQESGRFPRTLDLDTVKKPRIEQKEVNYLTEEEIGRFLSTIEAEVNRDNRIGNVRMMALVRLLLESGARIGEALSIKVKEIDWDNNEIPIIGKGKRPRMLYFRDGSKYWLKRYLAERNSDHELLFVTQEGLGRWFQTDVGRSFRRFRDLSGIKKPFTIHTLRHCTATHLYSKGVQLNVVQKILGHKRLETTVKYYVGTAEKEQAKKVMRDSMFDFIPSGLVEKLSP